MSKTLKRWLIVGVGGALAVGAGWWLLVSGLNLVVKSGIEAVGTQAAGAPVTLDAVDLSLISGKGEVSGLAIANPDGFDTDYALRLGRVFIHVDVGSLRSDLVVIHEIAIDGALLMAEPKRKNNLLALLNNARAFAASAEAETQWPTRFVVERFTFTQARLTVYVPFFPDQRIDLPDVELTDLGPPATGLAASEMPLRMLEPVLLAALEATRRLPFP